MGTPAQVEAVIAMLTAAHPDQPASSWDLLRGAMDDGLRSIDRRLEEYGPLEPHRFSLKRPTRGWRSWQSAGGTAHEIPSRKNLRE